MKKLLLLCISAVLLIQVHAQQLSWRLANPRIIFSSQQRFEFEIQVKASASGSYYSSGQVMLNFNNEAISHSSDLHWTVIPAGISAQTHPDVGNKYTIARVRSGSYPGVKMLIALSPTDEAVLDEPPGSGYLAELTTVWQTWVKVQCRITDASAEAGIYFDEAGTNGQNFFLSAPGIESAYSSPSLYESLNLLTASLARIYSQAHGWTQFGGAVNDTPFTDWSVAVNTSVWDGDAQLAVGDALMNKLHIHAGASLELDDETNLTIEDMTMNESGSNGFIMRSSAVSSASLLHQSNHLSATYERYLSGNNDLTQMAYHTVSVPITFGAVAGFFIHSYLYRFDAENQGWATVGSDISTPLNTHEGFLVYYPFADTVYQFQGMLFNDQTSLDVSYHTTAESEGMNLVPNPFPSAIDWENVAGWQKTNIANSFWIWNPVLKNYAAWGDETGINGASQYIPSGQAFFVKATADNPSLSVSNEARLHHPQTFFKQKDVSSSIHIRAISNGYGDEAVIRLKDQAHQGIDSQEDIYKLYGSPEAPQIYSTSAETALSVNTIPPQEVANIIPIAFQMDKDTTATLQFSISDQQQLFSSIQLEDTYTNTFTEIMEGTAYSFIHQAGSNPDRFLLHFLLLTNVDEQNENVIKVWSYGRRVYCKLPALASERYLISVTDLTGKTLFIGNVSGNKIHTFGLEIPDQAVVVTVVSNDLNYFGKHLISE